MIGDGKKSKRKKKTDPCDALWSAEEAKYLQKEGGAQEWATEKNELYCNGTKIIIRESDDADVPFTDKQMKKVNKK